MMPGMVIPIGMLAAGKLFKAEYVDGKLTGGNTVTCFANVYAGDLLLAINGAEGTSALPAKVIPTGFTEIRADLFNYFRNVISFKLANGSESNTVLNLMTGNNYQQCLLLRFRGNVPIKTATPAGAVGIATASDPSPLTITCTSGVRPVIAFGAFTAYDGLTGLSFTPAVDAAINPYAEDYVGWKCFSPDDALQNVVIDIAQSGAMQMMQGFYFNIT